MRALAYLTLACMDRARRHPDTAERTRNQDRVEPLTPVVKGMVSREFGHVTTTGIRLHGGVGYIEETDVAYCLCDATITTIYEATTGILIRRKLARNKGRTPPP
jgi:3-(methylthio)propanoyl-CoA dehydrogenase